MRRAEAAIVGDLADNFPMTQASEQSAPDAASTGPPDGISAFAARVLDQLTLSAWLPAALLTASVAVLLEFRRLRSADLLAAVAALTADPVRILVLTIPVLILATVVTQAFSFEAIRALEGYWSGPFAIIRTLLIHRQVHRYRTIKRRYERACEVAFYAARPRMLRDGIPVSLVNAMETDMLGTAEPLLTSDEEAALAAMNWRDKCDPWRLAIIDRLLKEMQSYPTNARILPTRLGNLLRATEDQLSHAEGDPESFAFRRRGLAPYRVRIQHDQFRNRLEMYCTLVFVSVAVTVLTPTILAGAHVGYLPIILIAGGFAALAQVSYLAATASARGYCSVLRQMDRL